MGRELSPRPALRRLAALLAALAATIGGVAGCGPAGPPPPVTVPAPALSPWELPASEMDTQRLFRAHYEGPDGGGGFRLTLRLVTPDHWQAQANALGRKLWSLEANGQTGLWLDHRKDVFCRLDGRLELDQSLLAPLPFRAFPALLLGRLPEPPSRGIRELRNGEVSGDGLRELVVRGEDGRRWRARVENGQVRSWTLEKGGRLLATWELRQDEAVLTDRDHGIRLRWHPVVREALSAVPEPLRPPPDYRAVECRGLDLEIRDGEGEPLEPPPV